MPRQWGATRAYVRELNQIPSGVNFSYAGQQYLTNVCLLYTSDAADERSSVDLGGRRIIKKKEKEKEKEKKKKTNDQEYILVLQETLQNRPHRQNTHCHNDSKNRAATIE